MSLRKGPPVAIPKEWDGSAPSLPQSVTVRKRSNDSVPATHELCAGCQSLLGYATARLEHCPYQEEKPTCVNCPVHCYHPANREKIKSVMRYAGPRLLWRHPILALRHVLDGWRKRPPRPNRAAIKAK